MAQAPATVHVPIKVTIDLAPIRQKIRRGQKLLREVGVDLAVLDDQLAALEQRAEDLAEFGIRLEVEHR